jgi:hypothetical protein
MEVIVIRQYVECALRRARYDKPATRRQEASTSTEDHGDGLPATMRR